MQPFTEKESFVERDIIDSLRFYIMMSIKMTNEDKPLSANDSMNNFIGDLKKKGFQEKTINSFVVKASKTLPPDFRKIYMIPCANNY